MMFKTLCRGALFCALLLPSAASAQELLPPSIEEVEAYEAAASRFRERMNEFALDARGIVDQLEREERSKVAFSYDTLITELNTEDKTLRAETIKRFESFLNKYPRTEYSPHVMFRLAELYYEVSGEEWAVEMDEYTRLFENLTDEELFAMEELPEEPRLDQSRSIALYKRILANHPDYEFIPGTLYMLGFSYGNTTSQEFQQDDAEDLFLQYFTQLVEEHPESNVAAAGNWRLGMYYFDENDVETAIPYFTASRDRSEDGERDYQLNTYMLAWSHYKLSDYKKALGLFTELLDLSEETFQQTGQVNDTRKEAVEYSAYALADIADRSSIVFSDPGWFTSASPEDQQLANLLNELGLGARPVSPIEVHNAWFKSVGRRDFELDIMKQLAEVLQGYSRFDEAIATYQYIQQSWPNEPLNPRYQREIAAIQARWIGDTDAAGETMAELAERYGEDSSWALANRNNPDALNEARGYIEDSLYDVAKGLHQRAQIAREDAIIREEAGEDVAADIDASRALFSEAADRYAEYLEQFPFADAYFEASWYHADALFNAGRYREAIAQDEQLLKVGGHDYVEVALYQRFYARYLIIQDEYGGPETVPSDAVVESTVPMADGGERQLLALSPDHVAFIEAADAVRSRPFENPDVAKVRDDNLSALHYVPAQILFYHNRYEEARPRLEALISQMPQTDDALRAAALIVNSYVADNDLEKVVEVSNKYRLMQLGANPAEAANKNAEFTNLEEAGKFKLALRKKEGGDYIGAAEDFLTFIKEFPKSDKVPLALYNAANTYEDAGKAERANELYEQYINDYPKGEFAKGLFWRIATNYGAILEMDKAIEYYERLASLYPDDQNAPAAIFNAGFLKVGQGDNRGAATNFEYYVKKWPNQPDAEQVYWLAGEQWKLVGDREALGFYTRYLRQFPDQNVDHVIEAKHWIATYYESEGNRSRTESAWDDVTATYASFVNAGRPIGPKGRNLAAEAAFRDLKDIYDEYIVVNYPKSEDDLVTYLLDDKDEDSKLVLLLQLEQRSLALVQTYQDFEFSSGAIYLWGSAYLAYSDMLFNAPCPPKFNDEQCLIYQDAVAAKAQAPQEKGVNRLQQNLDKATEEKRSSEWIDRTIERLNEFDPSTYPLEKPESRGYAAAQVIPAAGPIDQPEAPAEGEEE